MVSNSEAGRLFSIYAELLALHDKNEKLVALLSGASYRIKRMDEPVCAMSKEQLNALFRPQLIPVIEELKSNGSIEALDELIQLTPAGLFEMMRIKGLGGKKLSVLWKDASIDNLESLLQACKKGELTELPGFGKKTEQNIIAAIEAYHGHKNRFHFATVADYADSLVDKLQEILHTKRISLCGETRRQCTTVAGIEIVAACTVKQFTSMKMRKLLIINSARDDVIIAHTPDEIPVTIYLSSIKEFYYQLFMLTGSPQHVQKLFNVVKNKKTFGSENEIYEAASLPYVVPAMREDVAEWNFTKANDLVTVDDIKGVVHNHTNWSDGVDTLEKFVSACQQKKYQYVVISDHSKNAYYAGGLKEDKVLKQMQLIDKLNKKLTPFRIFKSIECDILVSGELDYDSDMLKQFDLVIISIHQLLKMNEEKATDRIIKAIENPYTTILGHMSGRQLLIRPGYPLNFKKVIDACAANNVVIEVNANPYRLDMDWSHIPYAMEKGVMISINPDAHSISEIENIRWGVSAVRKGGLTKDMTWNALPLKQMNQWLKNKKKELIV
jgi:DNA polymerase (family 10)